ncbi:uncharacterized protein LOC126801884 isoform X2 [Argentina anserina]|uniref:uncharacterized protein LOC126801884 isoform X2 n=1 Tax=Argentina anserina TaxID=57926 RepID=UPI0021766063|nr:uncharacterized protein LOC126801884 isoform X2 [Potentilla anserina]
MNETDPSPSDFCITSSLLHCVSFLTLQNAVFTESKSFPRGRFPQQMPSFSEETELQTLDFIPSVSQWGEPKSYNPVGSPASGSLTSLLSSCLEEVRSNLVRLKALPSPGISTLHVAQPKTLLFGFSKGGTVLNQIVTELGFSDIETSEGELMDEKKINMEEELHTISRTKESLLNSIREIHYVDVGLNSPGSYITDHSAVERISKCLTQVGTGICFIIHGTPRQWCDNKCSWICDEKNKLVQLLETAAQKSGGKLQVCEKLYFANMPSDLQMHFEIIEKLDVR